MRPALRLACLLLCLPACDQEYVVEGTENELTDYGPALDVTPDSLSFGAVMHDAWANKTLTLSNTGNALLELDNIRIADSGAFTIQDTDWPSELRPQEQWVVNLTYLPTAEEDAGYVVISSSDPENPETWVALLGEGLFPILDIRPDPYDMGGVPIGCAFDARIDLQNDGGAPLIIEDVAHAGVGFALTDKPTLPVTLEPGEEVEVRVAFTPWDLSAYEGSLWVTTNDAAGTQTATQTGWGTALTRYSEEFWQPDGPWEKVDIFFHVDQSGSMIDDQENLARNFDQFTWALEDWLDDYQVMVSTDDDGCHNEIIINQDTDYQDIIFQQAVTGPSGNLTESGLSIAENALEQIGPGQCNEGFARWDAKVMLVLVSDEPEQSLGGWESRLNNILDILPDVTISAIAGAYPGGCATAEPGYGYYEASVATGGAFLSICEPDWGNHVRNLAFLSAGTPTDTFALTYQPVESSITVTLDDETSSDWTYDRDQNAVAFDDEHIPGSGAHVVVSYDLGCSDM